MDIPWSFSWAPKYGSSQTVGLPTFISRWITGYLQVVAFRRFQHWWTDVCQTAWRINFHSWQSVHIGISRWITHDSWGPTWPLGCPEFTMWSARMFTAWPLPACWRRSAGKFRGWFQWMVDGWSMGDQWWRKWLVSDASVMDDSDGWSTAWTYHFWLRRNDIVI